LFCLLLPGTQFFCVPHAAEVAPQGKTRQLRDASYLLYFHPVRQD
jgi:hypothetical protein